MPQRRLTRPDGTDLLALAVGALASLATLAWVVAALVMSSRGLDLSDEGFYLLSYRWWDDNPRAFSGVQYLYGPWFQLLGYDVQALRVLRLVTVLGTGLALGIAAARWTRATVREHVSNAQCFAVAALVTAAGGITYAWLPLSPGYNDVSLLGTVLLAALMLEAVTATIRDHRLPVWVALVSGPVVMSMLLAKWASAAAVLVLIVLGAGTALLLLRARGWWRFLGAALVSLALSVGALHLLVHPVDEIVDQMLEVSRLLTVSSNSPTALIDFYVQTTLDLVRAGWVAAFVGVVVFVVVEATGVRWLRPLALVAPVVTLWIQWRKAMPHGGTGNVPSYAIPLVALSLAAAVSGLLWMLAARLRGEQAAERPGRRQRLALIATTVTLVLLAAAHGLGTGNALYYMAVNGFALWMVPLARVAVGPLGRDTAYRSAAVGTAVLAAGLCSWVAVDGLLHFPYRMDTYALATTPLETGSTGELKVNEAFASQTEALRVGLADEISPAGRPMMAFDEMAGLVLLLDGRPVGEAWYSASDLPRSAAGIIATCSEPGWWGEERGPLVLIRRAAAESDIEAIRACGYDFPADFTSLAVPGGPPGVGVYVPKTEKSAP